MFDLFIICKSREQHKFENSQKPTSELCFQRRVEEVAPPFSVGHISEKIFLWRPCFLTAYPAFAYSCK